MILFLNVIMEVTIVLIYKHSLYIHEDTCTAI